MNAQPSDSDTGSWDARNVDAGPGESPLWRRLHPEYRPHEHHHPSDDPWDDQRRIDGIIEQTHADLNGHPVEQIERVLLKRFEDSNLHLHLTPDVIRAIAEDVATEEPSHFSARSLEGAIRRRQERDDARGVAPSDAPPSVTG